MRLRDSNLRGQLLVRRRLLFETLESRDLLAVMRIVDWNTFNGPNDATGDANFSKVLAAIGNESVQGNTQRIDILALQETDPPGAGDSITRVQNVLNTLYSTTTYSLTASPVDGGGDSTGFVYDTSTVSLLESVQIGSGTLTHNITRAKFQPVGSPLSTVFYVYSVHLKSGTSGSDATLRGSEAAFLRADADALGQGTQVLMVGDFNMNGSSEAAWTNIIAAGAGQLQDTANAPGNWADNAAFKSLHSQDPGGAMDDRFDIQFASGEFFDGSGVDYVSGSFHIFGNNGTHTLNSTIDTGTGAAPDVLAALIAASDHLPAVADYRILAFTPSVIVSETLGTTKVVEGGLYDTYQVVLNTAPTSNVVVTVSPNSQIDLGAGAGVAVQLTFTPANAFTPQTIIVNAANDLIGEGDHSGLITHTSTSADAAYNGLSISSVVVAIIDNDAPKIVINELDSDTPTTPANDSLEFIELYDGGVGNVSLTGYTVVFFNGGQANNPSYASFDLTGKTTNAQGFFVLGNPNIVSGMAAANSFSFGVSTLQNGPDGVGLYFGVAGAVATGTLPTAAQLSGKLKDAIVYNNAGTQDADLIADLNPGQPQVNENQNSLGTTQSLSRVPDGGTPLDTTKYVAQTPTPATYNQALPYGALVLQSAGHVDVLEGGATDSYQLALLSIPTANVQISVDPDNQTDLGAGTGMPILLTFTPANALIPQLITVMAVNDGVVEGAHTSTITHSVSSADSRYSGFALSNVVANITDYVFLAGDYNANGIVDAADYVLWRKTLGSTTDLRADGSGPSSGVPNGVVDQFDYTYWRSRFGAVSGSGSGSVATASESAAASSLIEVSPVVVTVRSAAVSEPTQAVDVAVADFEFAPAAEGSSLKRKSLSRGRAVLPLTASSTDLLLTLARSTSSAHGPDRSLSTGQAIVGDQSCDVDELFASLGSDFSAGIGSSMALI